MARLTAASSSWPQANTIPAWSRLSAVRDALAEQRTPAIPVSGAFLQDVTTSTAVQAPRAISSISMGVGALLEALSASEDDRVPDGLIAENFFFSNPLYDCCLHGGSLTLPREHSRRATPRSRMSQSQFPGLRNQSLLKL